MFHTGSDIPQIQLKKSCYENFFKNLLKPVTTEFTLVTKKGSWLAYTVKFDLSRLDSLLQPKTAGLANRQFSAKQNTTIYLLF